MDTTPEFKVSLKKVKKRVPVNIRALIYSFLPFNDLINTISKLSKQERDLIITSEILDQPRSLKITFRDDFIYDITSLKYMMKLLTRSKVIQNGPAMIFEGTDTDKSIQHKSKLPFIRESVRSVNSSSPVLK